MENGNARLTGPWHGKPVLLPESEEKLLTPGTWPGGFQALTSQVTSLCLMEKTKWKVAHFSRDKSGRLRMIIPTGKTLTVYLNLRYKLKHLSIIKCKWLKSLHYCVNLPFLWSTLTRILKDAFFFFFSDSTIFLKQNKEGYLALVISSEACSTI